MGTLQTAKADDDNSNKKTRFGTSRTGRFRLVAITL